jgi:hypothetical protein
VLDEEQLLVGLAPDESRPGASSYYPPRRNGVAREAACTPKEQSTMAETVKGPAFYFPSIEKTYGRSIDEWKSIIRSSGLTSWKELMALLKTEHGMGHGHANALVVHTLKENE